MENKKRSRREFLAVVPAAAVSLASLGAVPATPGNSMPICIFSKHLQWLDYKQMGKTAAQLGFDGIDLTVRPRGHVLPERAREDLPRAVEAVREAGIEVHMMTTGVTDAQDPTSRSVLETAARSGVRYYRPGYFRYQALTPMRDQLSGLEESLRKLAELNRQLGIYGGYQNHAGADYVGAPIWDLWYAVRNLDPRWIGCQFDIRHAAVEGTYTWPLSFRLIAPHTGMLAIKDFRRRSAGGTLKVENCPLGEGEVDFPAFFKLVREVNFKGPISLHFEYELGGAEHGGAELKIPADKVLHAMRQDLEKLRGWLDSGSA